MDPQARIVLRPLGSPLALGLFAVTVQTTMLAALQLDWISPQEGTAVAISGLAFAAPAQLVTSVLAFLGRDAVAATVLGVFAGTWAVSSVSLLTSPPGARSEALGVFLILAAILLACCLVTSIAGARKLVLAGVLLVGLSRLLVTGLYEINGSSGTKTAAGVLGLCLGAAALYAGLAFLIEDERRATLLPTLRRGTAGSALDDGVRSQLAELENEAGVRRQL